MRFDFDKLKRDEGENSWGYYDRMDERGAAFHEEVHRNFTGDGKGNFEYNIFIDRHQLRRDKGRIWLGFATVNCPRHGDISLSIYEYPSLPKDKELHALVINEIFKEALRFIEICEKYGYIKNSDDDYDAEN